MISVVILLAVALIVAIYFLMRFRAASIHFRGECNSLKDRLAALEFELSESKAIAAAYAAQELDSEPASAQSAPAAAPMLIATSPAAHPPHHVNPMPSPEVKRLFERLEQMMEADGLFFQAGIGRKELSAKLCTNENYLYNIVRQATGMTLQEWINERRLKYAKELLTTNKTFDVQQIAIASGFGTARTLQRQFKKRFDTSPIDLFKSTH